MPSRDVNAVTRLAEASWWRDNFRIGVSAFAGLPYMTSRDQLWYVMTSSASYGDALILSGSDVSISGVII